MNNSGFFQKILLDFCAFDCSGFVEEDVDVLAKPGGVVVANGLGIAES